MIENSFAMLYGKGVFTTVRIVDGKPFLWNKHWQRLSRDAARLGVDLGEFSEQEVHAQLDRKLIESGLTRARARLTFSDERQSSIWPTEQPIDQPTSLSIIVGELRPIPNTFKLAVSPFPINSHSPLAGSKTCNYLEQLLTLEEAKGRGFDEAVRVNERGQVASACMANLFWLRQDKLYTPALTIGCLPGTTREFILENLECEKIGVEIEELTKAEAIFLTSAGLGVVQVNEFEGRELAKVSHPLLDLLP